ncbi:MAG: hypothetical protein KGJ37_06715, partial [Verrucomicrobiota bacterium]|nr:hypothetical protein [Verrucomicrobiota bacterium]
VQRGAQSVDTAVGKIAMNMVYHDAGSVAYMVIFNDYPNGSVTKSGGPDKVYDGAVNGAVSSVHGKLRSSSPSKTGEVQGREIIVDIPAQKTSDQGSVARVRFFIVGDRLYQVMYIGPAGNEAKAEATGFLDSFRLLH